MFGNYPVNDDWIFVRQVDAFNHGIFTLSAILDPSFIVQGFLGWFWGRIFGINFVSLQVLTFLVTLLGLGAFIGILRLLKVTTRVQVVAGLLLFFNPLVFTSAFSFMTDNYFLTFTLFSIYFFFKYLVKEKKFRYVLIGSVFMLMSILVRQIGVLVGISFLLVLIKQRNFSLKKFKEWSPIVLSIVIGILVSLLWPRFGVNRSFILLKQVLERIQLLLLSLHYYPLFVFPLLLWIKAKFSSFWLGIITGLIFLFLLNFDIFPVGNILYVEGLYSKSDFRSNFSFFDNIFFKSGFSVIVAYSISKLILFAVSIFKANGSSLFKYFDAVDLFLILNIVFNFAVLLISSDFYDRYLLPTFISFFILIVKRLQYRFNLNVFAIVGLILFIFVTLVLQWEFSQRTLLMWKQARALTEKTGLVKQLDLNDTYTKYMTMVKMNDYSGKDLPGEFEKKCFVQKYTTESTSPFWQKAEQFEQKLDNKFHIRRKPFKSLKKTNLSRASKNEDKFIFNEEYSSLIFNLVGKKSYVASWCRDSN